MCHKKKLLFRVDVLLFSNVNPYSARFKFAFKIKAKSANEFYFDILHKVSIFHFRSMNCFLRVT